MGAEISHLDELKRRYLADGQDKAKVSEWYEKAKQNIIDKYNKKAEKKAEAHSSRLTKLQTKANKKMLKVTTEFANDVAKAQMTDQEYDMYKLSETKDKYLADKVDKLAVEEWYENAKLKITDKYLKIKEGAELTYYEATGKTLEAFTIKTSNKLADLAKKGLEPDKLSELYDKEWSEYTKKKESLDLEYYKTTGKKLEVFTIETSQKMQDLAERGMSPDRLSEMYDKFWKDFVKNGGTAITQVEKFTADLEKQLIGAFGSLTSEFAKTGKVDIGSALGGLYDGIASGLKSNPETAILGYGMDIAEGLHKFWTADGEKAVTEYKVNGIRSIEKGISTLNNIMQPHYEETRNIKE